MSQLDILCYQVKPPEPGKGYILLSHQPKGSLNPPASQVIAKATAFSPGPDDKARLLRTALTYGTAHREVELVPNQKLLPYRLAFTALESSLHTTRREGQSSLSPSHKPCDLQQSSNCKIDWCSRDPSAMQVTNHFLVGFKAHSTRLNPKLASLKVTSNLRLEKSWAQGKTNYYSAKGTWQ